MGRIAAPYGVKGWLKILPSTADHETLLDHPAWWLRRRDGRGGWRKVSLETGRAHGNTLIVQLQELDNREVAATYAGGEVGVARATLPQAAADEVYVADLVGMDVVNRQGEALGRVVAVQEFGAHPVLRIDDDAGASRLVPFVEAYIDAVDASARRISVDWHMDY